MIEAQTKSYLRELGMLSYDPAKGWRSLFYSFYLFLPFYLSSNSKAPFLPLILTFLKNTNATD